MRFALVIYVVLSALLQGFIDAKRVGAQNVERMVTFRLYSREEPYNGVILSARDKVKLHDSGFNGSLPTVMCAHGFMDNERSSWVVRIKQDILREEDANFITVDYSDAAKNILYNEVVKFTKEAGRYTGMFLKFLQNEGGSDIGKAHLIGHSLGAQLLGFAARAFPNKKTIGRISALDPAGPLFENAPESGRLNPDTAKVVDVIHTCTFFIGMKKPVGTIDFYPNGGFHQPGCSDFDLTNNRLQSYAIKQKKAPIETHDAVVIRVLPNDCNHYRSREYFYQTIDGNNRNKYMARKCETLQDAFNGSCHGMEAALGFYLNYSSPGIYYLKI